jgi:hypothetical protein
MTLSINDAHSENVQIDSAKLAGYRRLIARLPITMRPSLNQQLNTSHMLFPFEQERVEGFLRGLGSFEPPALDALTAKLRMLEKKMGVEHWNFSQDGDTMENASLLARSEHYAEWRREVQQIFAAVNAASIDKTSTAASAARLILLILPECLPVDPATAWKEWGGHGHEFKIEGDARKLPELLVQGQAGKPGIAALLARQGKANDSDLWLIDVESKLGSLLPNASSAQACILHYAALKPFRDRFLSEVNKVPKSIEGSDQVLAEARRKDWGEWWPAELAGQTRLRNFVVDLFLSGNGALIFGNAFAEWAASEALRRARPRGMVVRFGMRSKPKLFTGIAIFENQQQISALPDVDDREGSAVDALILARYVWLAASRYPEYEQAYCLCVSEFSNSAYLICPEGRSAPWSLERPVTPDEICLQLAQIIST